MRDYELNYQLRLILLLLKTITLSSYKHKWNVLKELLCDIKTVRKSGCVKKPERGFGRVVSSLFPGFGLGFGEFF